MKSFLLDQCPSTPRRETKIHVVDLPVEVYWSWPPIMTWLDWSRLFPGFQNIEFLLCGISIFRHLCPNRVMEDPASSCYMTLALNVCLLHSVRLWPRPGGLLHEEWGISVHTGLPANAWHPLQRLRGFRGGGGGHCSGKDLPPGLLRLHHLQVRTLTAGEEKTQRWMDGWMDR